MNDIEKSIIKTISYFDIFSRPLGTKEIFENLQVIDNKMDYKSKVSFFCFKKSLEVLEKKASSCLVKTFKNQEEFWFFKKRENLVKAREEKEKFSIKLWKKLEKISKIINLTPFLSGVFVSGSLAMDNINKDSDIDLLIIAKPKRIFTVRFFLTFFLDVAGQRRKPGKIAGKICLNHYFAENSLEMKFPSLYNAYTYSYLKPIINRENVFKRFRKENKWLKNYLLFWEKEQKAPFLLKKPSLFAKFLEKTLSGSFGNRIEKKLKESQIRRKKKNYPQKIKKGRVILNDNLIELHPNSPEDRILKEYSKKLDFYLNKC